MQHTTHINLLQRTSVQRPMALALSLVLAATLAGLWVHGSKLRAVAAKSVAERDALASKVKLTKAEISVRTGQQIKSADALALRKQIEQLQPEALAAQGLVDALRRIDDGRSEAFSRALSAATAVAEPGLWLTSVTLSASGKKLELAGTAANGASVLRYARRLNDALRPLSVQLNALDMVPAAGGAAGAPGAVPSGAVSFRLN